MPTRPWFKLKARLSFREWADAERRGTLSAVREWLRQAEAVITANMAGITDGK